MRRNLAKQIRHLKPSRKSALSEFCFVLLLSDVYKLGICVVMFNSNTVLVYDVQAT